MNQGNHLDQQPEVTQQAAPAAAPEVQSAQPAVPSESEESLSAELFGQPFE